MNHSPSITEEAQNFSFSVSFIPCHGTTSVNSSILFGELEPCQQKRYLVDLGPIMDSRRQNENKLQLRSPYAISRSRRGFFSSKAEAYQLLKRVFPFFPDKARQKLAFLMGCTRIIAIRAMHPKG